MINMRCDEGLMGSLQWPDRFLNIDTGGYKLEPARIHGNDKPDGGGQQRGARR